MRRLPLLALIASVALTAGCGSSSKTNKGSAPIEKAAHRLATAQETRDIHAVIAKLQHAIVAKDSATICTRLYTKQAANTEIEVGHSTCEASVSATLKEARALRLTVAGKVSVYPDTTACPDPQPGVLRCKSKQVPAPQAGTKVTSSAHGRRPFQTDAVFVKEQDSWHVDGNIGDYALPPQPSGGADSGGDPGSGD